MKKIIIGLLFISIITTPCYAVNVFDKIVYKEVVLRATHIHILVNRLTGEVKYVVLRNRKTMLLTGTSKRQYQASYDAQNAPKQP